MVEEKEGWGVPGTGRRIRKAHYFVDGRSLCREWRFSRGPLGHGNDESPDNCAECKRTLLKQKYFILTSKGAECKRALAKRKQTLEERQKKLQKYLDNGLRGG